MIGKPSTMYRDEAGHLKYWFGQMVEDFRRLQEGTYPSWGLMRHFYNRARLIAAAAVGRSLS